MTDLYPKLTLWRSLNGWTYLIDGPPSYVHHDGGDLDKPLVVQVHDAGMQFEVVVRRVER